MTFWKAITGARQSAAMVGSIMLLPLTLAACGPAGGGLTGGSGSEVCSKYPSKDMRLVVPYSPGGGFDVWARLMEPFLVKHLGGDIDMQVENVPGGGGMRAVNELHAAPPDGTTVLFTEPGYIAVNQVLGRTSGDFDLRDLTYLGQATADPQVFAVAADSDITTFEDLTKRPIKHAGQDISPIETITYAAYGIDAEYILHEGTSEVALAVRRGDSDATVISLSSILEFLEAGELKPVLYLGKDKITPDTLGYEHLKDTPTADETGHPELAKVLEQHRVLAGPPKLPGCVEKKLSSALSKTLADPDFKAKAKQADLQIVPETGAQATEQVSTTLAAFKKYQKTLQKEISG
ncbi:MAG: Bug family tripartite tricarboxylate transporter substrate binding protein [Micromonosporaceae bacterium]